MRWVSTRVFPEPAPARMRSGPPGHVTASRCGSLRPSRSVSTAVSGIRRGTIDPAPDMLARMPFDPDEVRRACARVAAVARRVRIAEDRIPEYARTLPPAGEPLDAGGAPVAGGIPGEARAAASLQLNAVNFGSGWFPTLRKPPGLSGFRTVEAGLRRRGPWSAAALRELTAAEVADVVGQDPGHELMGLFAAALRELGDHVAGRHGGSFAAVAAGGSTVAVAAELAELPMWRDVSAYDGEPVPFYKRAQIAAADLLPDAADLPRLTIFADNLVPHVLAIDGVLELDPELVARIEREELIEHG